MCTLSWQIRSDGYDLWFSRDESIQRPIARAPEPVLGGWALAPVDPQGGGTWLAVNRAGMSLALLNAYELTPPSGALAPLISRGTVIPMLLRLTSPGALEQHLRQHLSGQLAPFRLVVVWPDGQTAQWCWQGQSLLSERAVPPVVSSGIHTAQVGAIRAQLFAAMQGDLEGFHRSHWPEQGYRSVCMHRPEAHTVSLTHVQVSHTRIQMRYQPGSPCQERPWQPYFLDRLVG